MGDSEFGVRLIADIVVPGGEAAVSVAGEYDILNNASPSERECQLFANEVAVMTVYPYLRESIATITAKVFGRAVHLPIVQRGDIALDVVDN